MTDYHGTIGGYTNHRCRCAECRKANAQYYKRATERRAARLVAGDAKPEHGTYSTYVNYRCRCAECTAANAQRIAELRRRVRMA